MASLLLFLINSERTSPLVVDPRLEAVAQKHAEAMYDHGRLWHQSMRNLRQVSPSLMIHVGENIARGDSPEVVHKMWMKSRGHRANIKNTWYNHIGIGQKGRYWCVCFSE